LARSMTLATRVSEKTDLTYEGIETTPAIKQLKSSISCEKTDLTYEGIETARAGAGVEPLVFCGKNRPDLRRD